MRNLLVLGAVAMFATGCALFNFDINDQNVEAEFSIESDSTSWSGVVQFRPNDLEEIEDNKDKLEEVTVTAIRMNILTANEGNEAATGSVRGRARIIGGEWPTEDDFNISDFRLVEGTAPTPDNSSPNNNNELLPVDQDKLDRIRDLIFPGPGQVNDIEIEVTVEADGTPDLLAQVVVEFDAVANPF
jgi:hypothetical protein